MNDEGPSMKDLRKDLRRNDEGSSIKEEGPSMKKKNNLKILALLSDNKKKN